MKSIITGFNCLIFWNLIGWKNTIIILSVFSVFFLSPRPVRSSDEGNGSAKGDSGKPALIDAAMYEDIKGGLPLNQTSVFHIEKGRVICFSTFGDISEQTTIYHKWYFRDKLIYKIRLSLKPTRWSTYSSIKLRDADRGPWRVEITDQQNSIYQTLRFSIAD